MLRERLDAGEPVLIDDHYLPWLDVAHEPGVDQIQRAGLARQHPGVINTAEAQGPESVGIANANQLVLGHDDQRVGALDAVKGSHEVVGLVAPVRLRQQVQNDLTVNTRLEDRALGLEFLTELGSVGQVTVVRDGNLAAGAIDRERLGVAQVGRTRGRVARVADGDGAGHVMQDASLEDLRDQSHAFMGVELLAVGSDDARALLAAMLEGVEAVIGQLRSIRMAVNAEDTAVMFWIVIHQPEPVSVNAWLGRWNSTRGRAVRSRRHSKWPRGS